MSATEDLERVLVCLAATADAMGHLMRHTAPTADEGEAVVEERIARAGELAEQVEVLSRIAAELLGDVGPARDEEATPVAPVLDTVARLVVPLAEPRVQIGVVAGTLPAVRRGASALERELLLVVLEVLDRVPEAAQGWEMRITASRSKDRQVRIEVRAGPPGSVVAASTHTLPIASGAA